MRINLQGYLIHKLRNWWLVKFSDSGSSGKISFSKECHVFFPKKDVGKRVRFKVEEIPEIEEWDGGVKDCKELRKGKKCNEY